MALISASRCSAVIGSGLPSPSKSFCTSGEFLIWEMLARYDLAIARTRDAVARKRFPSVLPGSGVACSCTGTGTGSGAAAVVVPPHLSRWNGCAY